MNHERRLFTLAAALTACGAAVGQPGGDKAARVILSYPPGSGLDVVARSWGAELKPAWGQSPLIDNRPGASGQIAIAEFKRAAPDGQTLLLATSDQLVGNRVVYKSLPYDVDQDFTMVGGVYQTTFVITASQASGLKSVADVIAKAKGNPGKVSYATLGKGTYGHIGAEIFSNNTGISMLHVPFKDLGSLTTSVGNGDIDLVFLPIPSVDALIKAGRANVLASLSPVRQSYHPNIPTLKQAGGGDIIHMRGWLALVAHKATPKATVDRLQADILQIGRDPKYSERLAVIGGEPLVATTAELQAICTEELKYFREVAARTGMQLD